MQVLCKITLYKEVGITLPIKACGCSGICVFKHEVHVFFLAVQGMFKIKKLNESGLLRFVTSL